MKSQLEVLVSQMYDSGILYSEAVREFKKTFIAHVLEQHRGNHGKDEDRDQDQVKGTHARSSFPVSSR